MTISTPSDFIRLASLGLCGNTPRIWLDLETCRAEIGDGNVFIKSMDPSAGAFSIFHANRGVLRDIAADAVRFGGYTFSIDGFPSCRHHAKIADLYFMEEPNAKRQNSVDVFQADWIAEDRYMIWNVSNRPWGKCKRAGDFRRSEGLATNVIMSHYLDGNDIEQLNELASKYPGAVIEFTKFPWTIGRYSKGPLIWEVRHY